MRDGLVAKCIFFTLFRIRDTNDNSRGRRGRIEFSVMSRGPGTKTKWVLLLICGQAAIKSARASKFSANKNTSGSCSQKQKRSLCSTPWYCWISRALPWDIDRLVKLPQRTMTCGMNSFSMQLSKIFCIPTSVWGWSSHTSERKKKLRPGRSSWIRSKKWVLKASQSRSGLWVSRVTSHPPVGMWHLSQGSQCAHRST